MFYNSFLAFTCHDQGASCFGFAPQHQLLISCGKKGDICILDMRQRTLKHRQQVNINTNNLKPKISKFIRYTTNDF